MIFGFFDSGLGGLLMMEAIRRKWKHDSFIYIGDTENLPYGPKNKYEIFNHMESYLLWLFQEKNCDYVCLACNTASVKSLSLFIEKFPQYENKFIDIINPTTDFLKKTNKALVLATTGTVLSNKYMVHNGIHQISMPGLVDLIEEFRDEEALVMVNDVLLYYPDIEYIILACTHYVYLKEKLSKRYPKKKFITQSDFVFEKIKSLSRKKNIGLDQYFVTKESILYSQKYNKIFSHIQLFN